MSGAGGEEGDVSGADRDFVAVFATQHETCVTGGEAENFMGGGVVVMEIVDAVTPLRPPSVASEKLFEEDGGIGLRGVNDGAIKENGEVFVVGHPAVAGEVEAFWFGVQHRGASKGGAGRREREGSEEGIEMATSDGIHGVTISSLLSSSFLVGL